jgi:hypothetical protein
MSSFLIPENLAVSDTGFLFLPSTGETFTLSSMGIVIFKMLQQRFSSEEILNNLFNEYDADKPSLERDFDDFIFQLKKYSLIKEV